MNKKITKCIIATMFGVDTKDVQCEGKETVTATHKSATDNTEWKTQFKFKDGKVCWKMFGGRDRDHKSDIKILYKLTDKTITITENIPSTINNTRRFKISEL